MKPIKWLVLLSFVGILLAGSKSHKSLKYEDFNKKVISATQKYYGHYKRDENTLNSVFKASYLCAQIFNTYPASSLEDRTIKLYCYAAKEVDFERNHTEFNIPGVYLRKENRYINYFSIDFGISGLNSRNVKWTYEVAKILQEQNCKERHVKIWNIIDKFGVCRMLDSDILDTQIPTNIKLKQIDLSEFREYKKQYLRLKHKGYKPLQIRKKLKSNYKELTQDDIDSLLIYRILVDLERKELRMNYQGYSKELYTKLRSCL